jgi:hypothetical protein
MTTRAFSLSMELDFEGERITGRLADQNGNNWAFSCWLDLLTLIDRIATTTTSPPERACRKEQLR